MNPLRLRKWKNSEVPKELREQLKDLEQKIGYKFRHPELLLKALKHRSYLDITGETRASSNERLEFLGDSVLNLLASEYFYKTQSDDNEGSLTTTKSTIVSGSVLADQARKINLGYYLLLSENEARSGGRDRDSILEDTFEALIGAIYRDGGLKPARNFVARFLFSETDTILSEKSHRNFKSILQEYAQSRGGEPPEYVVLEESGPDHDKRFLVEVRLGVEVLGTGKGRTKKEAEQMAAEASLSEMGVKS